MFYSEQTTLGPLNCYLAKLTDGGANRPFRRFATQVYGLRRKTSEGAPLQRFDNSEQLASIPGDLFVAAPSLLGGIPGRDPGCGPTNTPFEAQGRRLRQRRDSSLRSE